MLHALNPLCELPVEAGDPIIVLGVEAKGEIASTF